MSNRNSIGQFIFNGGKKSELRDKPCPECGAFIMRKSKRCRTCSQKGVLSHKWLGGKPKCIKCGKTKRSYSSSTDDICRECFVGENHFAWRGDAVGYGALHDWVRRYKGKASKCINDNSHKGPYHWGNISGEYKRVLSDWHELCTGCNLNDGVKIHERFNII